MLDSDEIVSCGDDVGVHPHPWAEVAGFAQAADSLHPAERLLDPLSDSLAMA